MLKLKELPQDPEVEKAATLLQAGFRGMEARKQVAEMKAERDIQEKNASCNFVEDDNNNKSCLTLESANVETAATLLKNENTFIVANGDSEHVHSINERQCDQQKTDSGLKNTINYDDPEMLEAITIIQLGFHTILGRQKSSITNCKDSVFNSKDVIINETATEKLEDTIADLDVTMEKEDSLLIQKSLGKNVMEDIDFEDPEIVKASTTIQAGYRGMQARKEVSAMKAEQLSKSGNELYLVNNANCDIAIPQENLNPVENGSQNSKGDEIDINLSGMNEDEAATKLQSNFRGYQTRKEIKALKIQDQVDGNGNNSNVSITEEFCDSGDMNEDQAAVTLQANFRGHQARKEINSRKEKDQLMENEDFNESMNTIVRSEGTINANEDLKVIQVKSIKKEEIPEIDQSTVTRKTSLDNDEGGSISEVSLSGEEEEDSVQFSTSEAQRNVAIRVKKTPFSFLKKMINVMSVSTGIF